LEEAEACHQRRPEIAEERWIEMRTAGGSEEHRRGERRRPHARVAERAAIGQAAHGPASSRRGQSAASALAGGSCTNTSPSRTATGKVAIRYCGSETPAPVSSEKVRLWSGQATFGSSPCVPRRPRPRT